MTLLCQVPGCNDHVKYVRGYIGSDDVLNVSIICSPHFEDLYNWSQHRLAKAVITNDSIPKKSNMFNKIKRCLHA